jgi:Na+-driven multidrug efflux pump
MTAFAVRIVKMVDSMPTTVSGLAIARQIVRSGTSPSANYRAACLAKSDKDYKIDLKNLKLDKKMAKHIVLIGLPTGIQSSITGISNTFLHSYINVFGSHYESGYAIFIKLDHFLTVITTSFGYAVTSFIGQNIGANNLKRAKQGSLFTTLVALVFVGFLMIPLIVFAQPITKIFTNDTEVTAAASFIITLITPFQLFASIHGTIQASLRGCKKTKTSMYIVLTSFVVFRQVYLFIISKVFVGQIIPILLVFPFGWMLSALLHYVAWIRSPLRKAIRILKKHPEASHLPPNQIIEWKNQGYPNLDTTENVA